MRVLDLFSGLGGWSAAFKEAGHEVVTVDFDASFKPTIAADILHLQPKDLAGPWDIILASPPCNAFSVASIFHYWHDGVLPKKPGAYQGIALLTHALYLIHSLKPTYWIVENPRGMMRNLPFLQRFERKEVTYCQYGDTAQKPTDLWGVFPPGFEAKKCYPSAPCHAPAPRGSHGAGTVQGKTGAAARAEIPLGLSQAVLGGIP